jgi:hypothetical protein
LQEKLYSPKEIAELKILCLASQWKERRCGRLHCYRLGRKIFYGQKHLDDYFALCESSGAEGPHSQKAA